MAQHSTLSVLIQQQVNGSVVSVFQRTIDATADQMATELLKDATFRAEMQQLIREAFAQTLRELRHEATSE